MSLSCGDLVTTMVNKMICWAEEAEAQAIVTACPLCQANLDIYQAEAEKLLGERFSIPVIYFVQLMGLAMDLDPKRICLDKLVVYPFPILAQKGFIDGGAVYL